MGANQSTPSPPLPAVETPRPPAAGETITNDGTVGNGHDESNINRKKKKNKKEEELTGFALVQYKCRRKRKAYDKCYAKWYGGSFVTGQNVKNREESCDDLFDDWRECILLGMKKDREQRGLPPPAKDSMLSEVDEDDE